MSENQIITPSVITNESLRLLHEKLSFVRLINRRYSDAFKSGGARRSDEVLVRLPNRYVVREGAKLVPQTTEESVSALQLTEQKGVDFEVSSKELRLDLDDFSDRVLDPAISQLASAIEQDVLTAVLNEVVHVIAPAKLAPGPDWYDGMSLLGAWFDVMLIPEDQRRLVMNSHDQSEMIDVLQTYMQSDQAVSRQYETGRMTHFQGFDMGMSLSMPVRQARGRVETGLDALSVHPVDGEIPSLDEAGPDLIDRIEVSHVGAEIQVPLPRVGDWVTFPGVYPVHPETKEIQRMFGLKPFKVEGVEARTVRFSPPLIWKGPKQNAGGIVAGQLKASLNKATDPDKAYHWNVAFDPEAIAFVTADLALPKDVDFAHRNKYEGIALRVVRKYDINEDRFPCRIDVLYGRKLLRPDSVCLLVGNSDV